MHPEHGKIKRIFFIGAASAVFVCLLLFLFPILSRRLHTEQDIKDPFRHEVFFAQGLEPSAGDFLTVTLSLENTGGVPLPSAAMTLRWDQSSGYEPLASIHFPAFIDNRTHKYRIPVGQESAWVQGPVHAFLFEASETEGIRLDVREIALNRRILPAVDAQINRWVKDFFSLRRLNPFLVPAYLMAGVALAAGCLYIRLFHNAPGRMKAFVSCTLLALLLAFVPHFARDQVRTIRSHAISQAQTIQTLGIQETYSGFLDFRRFLRWADGQMEDTKGLIFLVRGEPVYIMSEAVYNLYPTKIVFLEPDAGSLARLRQGEDMQDYSVIIALTAEDFMRIKSASRMVIEKRYQEDAGFLIRLID